MVTVTWQGNMAFEVNPPSGNKITLDAIPEVGGENKGPTPVEALLGSIAACTAMDVISILRKKKQVVTSYTIEVTGERTEEGVYPRLFTSFTVKHILEGENLDPAAVARSVQLSDEKYCTVVSTLRLGPTVSTVWEIK
jgi:putative redox protein